MFSDGLYLGSARHYLIHVFLLPEQKAFQYNTARKFPYLLRS